MKNVSLIALVIVALATRSVVADEGGYKPLYRTSSEVFSSKVLKVYSVDDGDGQYAAYVVTWKGHEVVVSPGPVALPNEKRYAVGDTIQCQMNELQGLSSSGRHLSFTLALGSGHDAAARLQAIQAEVTRRRQLRGEEPAPTAESAAVPAKP